MWVWSCTLLAAAIGSTALPANGWAQAAPLPRSEIRIPALPLPDALAELSRQTGVSIGTEGTLPPTRTQPLAGRYDVQAALDHMLAGCAWQARRVGPTAWRIVRRPSQQDGKTPAASTPPPAYYDPVPIVVTAAKVPRFYTTVPRAISVVLPDEDGRDGPRSGTSRLAEDIDGLTLGGPGPGRNQVFLRGVADSPFGGTAQSTVAVLVDGVRLTYDAPDPDLRLVDVARVEVLKGPQGSLYGTGSLGGIIQIVPNPVALNDTQGMIQAGVSALSGGSAGYSVSGMVNAPIVPEKLAARLVGYNVREGGWIDTGARRNTNRLRVYGGRLQIEAALGDDWHLTASGIVQRLDAADTQYVYTADAKSRPDQQAEPHDNDLNNAALHLRGSVGDARLDLTSGLTWHTIEDRRDASVGADSFGLPNPLLFEDIRTYRIWDSEARLSGAAGRLDWLAGLSHIEARQAADQTLYDIQPGNTLSVDSRRRTNLDSAAFANLTYRLGAGIEIEAGARLYRTVMEDRRTTEETTYARSVTRTGWTPSAAIVWRDGDRRQFYLRYGSAFRPGGIALDSDRNARPVASDELTTIEAGWRETLPHGASFDLGTYYTIWENVQSDILLPNGLLDTRNAGRGQIIGGELALVLPVARHWRIDLGGAVQDARLVRNDLDMPLDDSRLPVVPAYTGRLVVNHDIPIGSHTANVSAKLHYIGPARLSFDPGLNRAMGNYVYVSAEAHLRLGQTMFSLVVENLLNGAENTFSYGNPFRVRTTPMFVPQRPRTISFSIATTL